MVQRVKGQETRLTFTGPNGLEEGLEVIQSWEAELDIETLEEGYIGETANRLDDIYNKTTGNADLHLESDQYFRFVERVKARAQRRDGSANGVFTVMTTLLFSNGARVRSRFDDVSWGALPLRSPGRGEYVTVRVEWSCSEIAFLFG